MRSTSPALIAACAQLRRGVDARVDDDAAGEGLVGVERDLEAAAELVGDLVPVVLRRHDLRVAARRFERARARREALRREQRRDQARACRAPRMERLGHRAELLAQAYRLRRGDAERHRGLRFVELEQACAGRGRAEHAGRARDVPAAVVVIGVEGVAHAARHVDAEDERVDQRPTACAGVLGQRQRGRSHRTGRVDDRLQVRVVEVERVRRDAVDERGARHVDLVRATEDARLGRRLQHGDRGERSFCRLVMRCADRAAEPVVERAVRLVVDRVAPAAARMRGDELRDDRGDRRGVEIGGNVGVAGHGVR